MGDEHTVGSREHWLEVVGDGGNKTVYCPHDDRDMPLSECLRCKRYESLALDPAGNHVYIDCQWDGPGDPPPVFDGVSPPPFTE